MNVNLIDVKIKQAIKFKDQVSNIMKHFKIRLI